MSVRTIAIALLISSVAAPSSSRADVQVLTDFQRHPALLIGASQMMFHHETTFLDIARAVSGRVPVYGLVSNPAQAVYLRDLLSAHGIDAGAVQPVEVPVQTMWVRDYGPIFVGTPDGRAAMIDARYVGTEDNPDDEDVPAALGAKWNVPVLHVELRAEGGHLVSNGAGLVFVSNALINFNLRDEDVDGNEIGRRLSEGLPFSHVEIVLPLRGEPTGHIDMYMIFLDTDLLLVARLDPEEDAFNAQRLDDVAEQIEGFETPEGPLRVLRVDTPAATDDLWRTYTNVAMAGDVVLVPTYDDVDPDLNAAAQEVYREALPERTVIPIEASSLVARRGALHCVSVPIPASVLAAIEASAP